MIAGSYDDMQGGICTEGIAHAGPPRLQPATWFDGSNDYVTVPAFSGLNPAAFTWLFDAFCRSPLPQAYSTAVRSWVFRHIGVSLGNYGIGWSANTNPPSTNIYWEITTTSGGRKAFTPSGVVVNTIMRIGLRWTGSIYTLWVNDNLLDQRAVTGSLVTSTAGYPLGIGYAGSTRWFPGVIRDIKFFNIALTDPEMLNPPTPTAYWKGNGNTDDAWRDQVGTNHGTVYGSPERCLIRGDDKVILNNIILNP